MQISQKEILEKLSNPRYKPKTFNELCQILGIVRHDRKKFRRLLKNLQRDLKIIRTRQKTYRLAVEDDFVTGRVDKKPKGFGFLIPDDRSLDDLYLPKSQLYDVLDGDRVRVFVTDRDSGRVIEILERSKKQVVGRVVLRGKTAFVAPLGSSTEHMGFDFIEIPFKPSLKELRSKIVVCEIEQYPQKNRLARGKIKEILGKTGDAKVDFKVMVNKYELPHVFSPGILQEADQIKKWNLTSEIQRRQDLRKLPFVTIDGETAKDFDDAVCVEKLPSGHFKLWVSIADVSFFVKKHSAIDKEAYTRATSVYFPGGVIPMLPEVLSNDLCSLRPHEEKMTFTCEMEFDHRGNRLKYEIYESVIRSQRRLTYTEVQKMITEQGQIPVGSNPELVAHVSMMHELHKLLRHQKQERGCLDFDLPEPEIILNMQGAIENIVKRPRLSAHMIIEEFMIAANEAVAEFMFLKEFPFIYRIHEEPDSQKLFMFHELLHNLGYQIKFKKNVDPLDYSQILSRVEGKPEENLINVALLRSMKQARYANQNVGHFGLASKCYTHFTSPIRRYPDLIVHRLLKDRLKKNLKDSDKNLAEMAEHCSRRERVVDEAEREYDKLMRAQFMQDKVGRQFVGFISGIQEFGIFIELEEYFVEGLVHVSHLEDDHYTFIEERYMMRGRRTKKEYHLGQKVTVELTHVDLDKRQIDFDLID